MRSIAVCVVFCAAAGAAAEKLTVTPAAVTVEPKGKITFEVKRGTSKIDQPSVTITPGLIGDWCIEDSFEKDKLTLSAPASMPPGVTVAEFRISFTNDNDTVTVPVKLVPKLEESDERRNFTATFYTGASIDSFAAQELKDYLYPEESGDKRLGYIAGVDFNLRLTKKNKWPQLWLYGETVHGQRSADVDCSAEPKPDACTLQGFTPTPGAFLGILRNGTSLEAFSGLRLELFTLNGDTRFATKAYVKSELGFLTITGSGGDVVDSHQKIAAGFLLSNGQFGGSYGEVGWGRTDLFRIQRGRRLKVDAYLTWDFGTKDGGGGLRRWMDEHGMQPFIQMTVDADFGKGSDSVRTYYGFNFDLRKLWTPAATP